MEDKQTTSPLPKRQVERFSNYSFHGALDMMMQGALMTKTEWDNNDIFGLFDGDILRLHKADGKIYEWILQKADIEGNDWVEVIKKV